MFGRRAHPAGHVCALRGPFQRGSGPSGTVISPIWGIEPTLGRSDGLLTVDARPDIDREDIDMPAAAGHAAFRAARIVVFGDREDEIVALERQLGEWGCAAAVGTTDASKLHALCAEFSPDLVMLDLGGPEGFELLEWFAPRACAEGSLPLIVLAENLDEDARQRAIALGARDFVTKPVAASDAWLRVRNALEARRLFREVSAHKRVLEECVELRTRELEVVRLELVQRLALAAEYRDEDGAAHVQRVGRTAALLARELGWEEEDVRLLRSVAPLHDIGNVGIPDTVLLCSGKLAEDEFELMKTHTVIGAKILSGGRSRQLRMGEQIARSHHERWDGSGYPDGLAGKSIPRPARLVAVADVFDALTHRRRHKQPWPLDDAVAEIERQAGSHFDPEAVAAFRLLDHEALLAPIAPTPPDARPDGEPTGAAR